MSSRIPVSSEAKEIKERISLNYKQIFWSLYQQCHMQSTGAFWQDRRWRCRRVCQLWRCLLPERYLGITTLRVWRRCSWYDSNYYKGCYKAGMCSWWRELLRVSSKAYYRFPEGNAWLYLLVRNFWCTATSLYCWGDGLHSFLSRMQRQLRTPFANIAAEYAKKVMSPWLGTSSMTPSSGEWKNNLSSTKAMQQEQRTGMLLSPHLLTVEDRKRGLTIKVAL